MPAHTACKAAHATKNDLALRRHLELAGVLLVISARFHVGVRMYASTRVRRQASRQAGRQAGWQADR